MFSRDAFDSLRRKAQERERTEGLWLGAVSVGLGLGQLLFMRWAERTLAHRTALALEGGVFIAYLALVVWLLWRRQAHQQELAIRCPGCGAQLDPLALRIAAATGRCDRCGARVLSETD